MSTFKVGDKVRCINPNDQIDIGQEGTVIWIDSEFLKINTSHCKFFQHRFERVALPFKGNIK